MHRAVVTPLIRSSLSPFNASKVSWHSLLQASSSRCSGRAASMHRWLWHSIMPGIRVMCGRLMSSTSSKYKASLAFRGRISRIIPSSMIREPFSKGVSCSPHKIIPAFNMVRFMSVCFLRLSISFDRLSLNQQLPLAGFRSPPVQGQECLQLCRELHSICGIPWTARIPAAGKGRL